MRKIFIFSEFRDILGTCITQALPAPKEIIFIASKARFVGLTDFARNWANRPMINCYIINKEIS